MESNFFFNLAPETNEMRILLCAQGGQGNSGEDELRCDEHRNQIGRRHSRNDKQHHDGIEGTAALEQERENGNRGGPDADEQTGLLERPTPAVFPTVDFGGTFN